MSRDRFEIGLTMAGAVSAGAYQAGVIDFLFQALDEWQAAKERGDPTVPSHDVLLKVVTGASAGGMTAAVMTAMADRDFPRVADPAGERHTSNNLFEAWVNRIDIADLLGKQDRGEDDLPSLLDSTVLDRIARDVFSSKLATKRRAYIASDFRTILCFTNQRGVPYRIAFTGETGQGHDMTRHGDRLEFVLSAASPSGPDGYWLEAGNYSGENWDLLRSAALASGAFPIGLAPRMIRRRRKDYESHPRRDGGVIEPSWDASGASEEMCFWAVDAGVTDNEPFQLARERLSTEEEGQDPQTPTGAGGMIIMVDPFVGREVVPEDTDDSPRPGLLKQMSTILGSAIDEARFKPEELALAQDSTVCNRFLIAPIRTDHGERLLSPKAIACGTLGAFGGFLSREFRVHDFILGRRNCQKFLQSHFALEVEPGHVNTRFKISYEESQAKGWLFFEGGKAFMPVIPLVGSALDVVKPPTWPVYGMDELDRLGEQMEARLDLIVQKIKEALPLQILSRPISWTLWGLVAKNVRERLKKVVRKSLEEHGLFVKIR